jgi:hypothetical protein
MIIGDSTAMATSNGLFAWARMHPAYLKVSLAAGPGCGMIGEGVAAGDPGGRFAKSCAKVRARLPAQQAARAPNVVLGMVTLTDVDDRTWSTDEGKLSPADPRFFDRLVAAYDTQTAGFLARGATRVLWIAPPEPLLPVSDGAGEMPQPARFARLAEALRAVAARHPGQVDVVDLWAWITAQPVVPARPDGLHWSPAASRQIANDLLAPLAVAAGIS